MLPSSQLYSAKELRALERNGSDVSYWTLKPTSPMSHAASQLGTGHKDPETARAHISVGTLGGASAPAHRDGTLSSSRFRSPMGIARMPGGRGVIVADTGNDAIREISLHDESSVRTLYGGRWLRPTDVSTCPDGFGYAVCDSGHHRISLLSSSGNTVTPLAGCGKMGFLDGTAPEARFHSPHGICYGPRGSLIIADSGNHVIRMLSNGFVTTIAGVQGVRGYADGRSNQALLDSPKRVLVTHDGSIIIADGNGGLRVMHDSWTYVETLIVPIPIGSPSPKQKHRDGPRSQARMSTCDGLCLSLEGSVVVADTLNHCIRVLDPHFLTLSTLVGPTSGECGATDGAPDVCRMNRPTGVCVCVL